MISLIKVLDCDIQVLLGLFRCYTNELKHMYVKRSINTKCYFKAKAPKIFKSNSNKGCAIFCS
jgi:hypothetical protein